MSCKIKNPNCVGGNIYKNGKKQGVCGCVQLQAIEDAFAFAGGKESHFKPLSSIEDTTIQKYNAEKNGFLPDEISYKYLANNIVNNIEELMKSQGKIYLWGKTGRGKTQFVNSLIIELAKKKELVCYIEAPKLARVKLNYDNPVARAKLEEYREMVVDKDVKVLIIDDMGSELSTDKDRRMSELLAEYDNYIIRPFQEKQEYLIIMTSNFTPNEFKQVFDDYRLISVLFQKGRTKYYKVSDKRNFRDSEDEDLLNFLD